MKKITLFIISILLLSGCKDYLDVEFNGKSTIAGFFSEYSGLVSAGVGLHRTILDFYDDDFIKYEVARGDQVNLTTNADIQYTAVFNYTITPEDVYFSRNVYKNGYTIITNANNILTYGPALKTTEPTKSAGIDKILGYAYFARALAHFNICNAYAQPYNYTSDASHPGICIMDHVPGFDDNLPRNSVAEVYDLVIKDLNKGIELLGDASIEDPYYISGIACEALLARVYLYMEDWDNAERYSKMVMEKVSLSPYSEYESLFRGGPDVTGTETILRMNAYSSGSSLNSAFNPTISNYVMYPDPAMESYYDDDDIRKTMFTYVGSSSDATVYQGLTFPAVLKYCVRPEILNSDQKVVCPIVLRASEMYLIHAEALANKSNPDLSGAAADIKALEARAKNTTVDNISLTYSSAADMNSIIERERFKELCYEGHRFFDIIRRKQDLVRSSTSNSTVKTITYPDYRFVLPINYLEMQANEAMIQNEGY